MYNELDSIYEGLYEYYINDYIIFEGILRRDYMECIGILNENAVGNFFKSIGEKIVAFCKKIKQWVSNVLERFRNAIVAFKETQYKQKLESFLPYFSDPKADDVLKNFTISGYRLITVPDKNYMTKAMSISEDWLAKLEPIFNQPIFGKDLTEITDSDIEKLNKLLNDLDHEEMFNSLIKLVYAESDIEKPFEKNGTLRISLISLVKISSLLSLGNMDKKFEKFLKLVNESIDSLAKNADKIIDEINKTLDKPEMKDTADSLGMHSMDENETKEAKELLHKLLKLLPTVQSKCNSIVTLFYNESVKETKELFRLYIAAGKYLKKNLGKNTNKKEEKTTDTNTNDNKEETVTDQNASYISDEYNNVFSESAIYELY